MAWSAGVFSRLYGSTGWVDDRDASTPILATRHDSHDQDISDGINACLLKDGTNAATGDLNIGGFKLTGVADPTSAQHAATKAYVDGAASVAFASGDQIIWRGASTPTGWTVASQNNKALRIVSGTPSNGGATAFTSVFGSGRTTGSESSHSHTITTGTASLGTVTAVGGGGNNVTPDHTHTGTTGGGSAHSHTVSLDVLYYDMQVIQKT